MDGDTFIRGLQASVLFVGPGRVEADLLTLYLGTGEVVPFAEMKKRILDAIVTDPHLAWDSSTLSWESQHNRFSEVSLRELGRVVKDGGFRSIFDIDPCGFPVQTFAEEAKLTKERHLDGGSGFVILDELSDIVSTIDEAKATLVLVSKLLGQRLLPQNKNGELVKEVMDRGIDIGEEGFGRYSESRQGGNLHTDGAEHPLPAATYLPLLCVRTGKTGGCSQLASAYAVHNKLLESQRDLLSVLYDDFYWDRRGDLGPNGDRTCVKPVFSYDPGSGLK